MSRCYSCGTETNKHLLGCPEYIFEKAIGMPSRRIPTADKVEVESFDFEDDYKIPLKKSPFVPLKSKKVWKSFLPLELYGGATVASNAIATVGSSPFIPCKPYRLWINELIAPQFMILGLQIGSKIMSAGIGKISAMLFRTGRWPIIDTPVSKDENGNVILLPADWKALEIGIDLSSWDIIDVGVKFQMQIENIGFNCCPFNAVLEVMCYS